MTTEPEGAARFYGEVVGWGTAVWDGGEKPYTMWTNGEQPIGEVMQLPEVGSIAVIRDPQGAVFAAYQPAGDAAVRMAPLRA